MIQMVDFYAIDFETANHNLTSACSLGIVGIRNGQIVYESSFLIQPEEPFEENTIEIHHITPSMVQDAPNFKTLWEQISFVFDNTILFAHNAPFDFGVLKAMLIKYHLPLPHIQYGCTVKLSRHLWDKHTLINHKLSTIASYLEEDLNHHQALSDARICAKIVIRAMKIYQVDTVKELYQTIHFNFASYDAYRPRLIQKDTKWNQKKIAMSGRCKRIKRKDIILKLASYGCTYEKNLNSTCDYFVYFHNGKKELLEQAIKMAKDHPLVILNEEKFLKMFYGEEQWKEISQKS